nr:hypothetical protein [Tanacetum cinerariifolium]
MLLVGGETENVPLYYHMYDNFHIQFGREEFCLVTGLKFGVEYSADYDDEDRPIPFRRRVFSSCLDGKHITGKNVEDLIKSKSFKKLDDNDAISLCCIGILQLVLLGRVPVEILIPDEVEAGSGWWLSSRAYFDGRVTEAKRRPRGDDVVITSVHDTAIYFTYVNVDPNKEDRGRQLVIMNVGHQFDNAITAKDELWKAYEECRDIPLRKSDASPLEPINKKSVEISVPNYTFQPDSPKMIFGFGIRPVTLESTLLKINYPLYIDGPWDKNESYFEKPESSFSFRDYNKYEDKQTSFDNVVHENPQLNYHKWEKFMSFKPEIPETPLYKSKPMISKEYKNETEVKAGNIFDNEDALVL